VGIPLRRDDDYRVGTAVSILFHALLLLLILLPLVFPEAVRVVVGGAGGPGPVGGGGGGTGGSGGREQVTPERLQYLQVVPPKAEEPVPVVVPPEVEEKEPEEKALVIPDVQTALPTTTLDLSTVSGIGGGTGNDGSGGTGPGTGGGVGSGVGTGRGSANGPGTGGGEGFIYPPTPDQMVIPPIPIPERVRGRLIVAKFDIDERGRIVSIDFNSSGDRGYDRKLRERLESFRFRPAVRADNGTPVRALYPVEIRL
jgi:protein TonB